MNATPTTLDRVTKVLRTTFPAAAATPITRETTSADIDGWDSLSHAMLIMSVEREFETELPFDEVFALENVGALCDLLNRHNAK